MLPWRTVSTVTVRLGQCHWQRSSAGPVEFEVDSRRLPGAPALGRRLACHCRRATPGLRESGDSAIIAMMRIENIKARIRRPRRDGLATPSRIQVPGVGRLVPASLSGSERLPVERATPTRVAHMPVITGIAHIPSPLWGPLCHFRLRSSSRGSIVLYSIVLFGIQTCLGPKLESQSSGGCSRQTAIQLLPRCEPPEAPQRPHSGMIPPPAGGRVSRARAMGSQLEGPWSRTQCGG